jgi:hypothetical protein
VELATYLFRFWPTYSSYTLFHPLSPSFSGIREVKKFLLNLSMKWWNSTSNAQSSRVIILLVQVGAVKIYIAAVTALGEKKRGDETQFATKIGGKFSLGPCYLVL